MTTVPGMKFKPLGNGQLSLVLLLLAWAGLQACSKQDQQVDWQTKHLYQTGMEELGRGNRAQAIASFRRVLARDSRHVGALCKLAGALLEANPPTRQQLDEAVQLATRATETDPQGKVGWAVLAQALEQAGRLQRALQARRRLLELDPGDQVNLVQAARLARRVGKDELALEILRQGMGPGTSLVRLELGKYLLEHDQIQKALEQFRAIPENSNEYLVALDEMGALAARQGDFARVREIYSKLVELSPRDSSAWELLAAVDEREGKFAAAEKKYRHSLDVNRRSTRSWVGLARCLLAQNKPEQARYALRQADTLVVSEPSRAVELAEVLVDMQELDWARSALQRAKMASKDQQSTKAIEKALARFPAAGTGRQPGAKPVSPGTDTPDGGRQGAPPR